MTEKKSEGAAGLRLAVLISGGGTNLQALIDRIRLGTLDAEIAVVVADRADAYGLARAEKAGIATHVVDYAHLLRSAPEELSRRGLLEGIEELDRRQKILREPDRDKRLIRLAGLLCAERELIGALDRYQPDYVCLAGFMRLVSPFLIEHFNRGGRRRLINIHPALLPAFPGMHGYRDTFEYGCKWGGVTIHFVDEGEDTGPIIAQTVYPIWPGDDLDRVARRGLKLEYEMYSQVIGWLAANQVEVGSAPSGRTITKITDPNYPEIMKSWIDMALSRNDPDT